MADEHDKQEEDRNIWQELLAKSSSAGWNTASTGTSTLIVLGDRVNGKSSVLNKFSDRVTDINNPAEYILDYSYINVKNKFNLDKDETVSRMSVWQLDDSSHSDLLVKLVHPQELATAGYVITVDLSKPWTVIESLNKWLEVLKDMNEKVITQLSAEEQANLKLKISKTVQTYVDPGVTKAAAEAAAAEAAAPAAENAQAAAAEGDAAAPAAADATPAEETPVVTGEISEEAAKEAEYDTSIPAVNLGVPLIIVGTKADYFTRVLAKSGADEKFELIAQRIRKIALDYGASTIFTSAVGEGANIELLQDYIFSRVLDMPNKSASKVVGSAEDFTIFTPSGFDSAELIASSSTSKSGYTDATELSEVFGNPPKSKSIGDDDMIVAMDNDSFFKALRAQLDKGVPFSAPPSTPVKDGKADQKYVKSFFKSLLNSGEKKKPEATA